jgi:hypothetical protein
VIASLRALFRFWWVCLLGCIAAAVVLIVMVYRVDVGLPPELEQRSQIHYVASTELLVDSPTGPYLRGATGEVVQPTRSATAARAKTTTAKASGAQAPTIIFSPDKKGLIDAANLFPLIIESDEVRAIREQKIGVVPGRVTATALYAIRGVNRYRPSNVPVIKISSTAGTPVAAVTLTQATTDAFRFWLAAEQDRAKVPAAQRILVRELRAPTSAYPVGGPKYGLPLLAAIAVLSAFAGLALVLDQSFPRRTALEVAAPEGVAATESVGASEGTGGKSVDELVELVDAALARVAGDTPAPTNGRRQAPVEGAKLERATDFEH